jgi:hypothetical protein
LKTVAELSKELNISTQALYKKIKACNLTVGNGGLNVVNRVNHVTPHGEAILRGEVQPEQPTVTNQNNQLATEFATYLQGQIKIKDEQIHSLQEENARLVSALENVTASLQAAQALHAGTIRQQIESGGSDQEEPETTVPTPPTEKQGIFARIFRKNGTRE